MKNHYPLTSKAKWLLEQAGLRGFELVREFYTPEVFGNAESDFAIRSVLVRFWSDRGDEYLEVAKASDPRKFYQAIAVDVARQVMTSDEARALQSPGNLEMHLGRLSRNLDWLEDVFAGRDPHGLHR